MLGDTAIAVNPKDDRYNSLIGKKITLPLTGREVPVVGDDYVDSEFGTGCVKITPAHDFNDFEIGKRHDLEIINILNLDGTLNDNVPDRFIGLDRKESRKKVLKEMESLDLLEKIEPHKITIPTGDRSNSILEPLITKQWFVNQKELSLEAVRVVKEDETSFVPRNWENTYFSWMDEIQDWCVSRQLWWGHRIPAWFDEDNNIFVAENEDEVRKK
jgi:valyl-tRNA synthetase